MINLQSNQKLVVESKPVIEIEKLMNIQGMINVKVPYKIVCDLSGIPSQYHSVIIQTLMIK